MVVGGDVLPTAFLPDEDDLPQELVSYFETHYAGRREFNPHLPQNKD